MALVAAEELVMAGRSVGTIASLGSHAIALPPILHHGTHTQKEQFVRPVLEGRAIAALGITYAPRLARIVRGADTDALKLAPQSDGLLAISLGFSKNFNDDHAMLAAMMPVYDALYRWVLDATDEKHNWTPA